MSLYAGLGNIEPGSAKTAGDNEKRQKSTTEVDEGGERKTMKRGRTDNEMKE